MRDPAHLSHFGRESERPWRAGSMHSSIVRARPEGQPERLSEKRMEKPRIFLGSSGKQAKLLQALTRGLEDVAQVEPWTTSFNPGTTTLERLLELTREVDFAAFVFAQDD